MRQITKLWWNLIKWKDVPCSWIGRLGIIKRSVFPKLTYRFSAILVRISESYFVDTDKLILKVIWASLVAQRLKCLPARQETWVQSLGQEDPLEKEMATHSSILAWRIPWTEEPGGLLSMGSQRVRHDWATWLSFFLSSYHQLINIWGQKYLS